MAAATDRFFPKKNGNNIQLVKGIDFGEDDKLIKDIDFIYKEYKFVIKAGTHGVVTTEKSGNPREISFHPTATMVIGPVLPTRAMPAAAAAAEAAGVVAGARHSPALGGNPYPFHLNNHMPSSSSSGGGGGASASSSSGTGGGGGGSGGGFLKRVEAAAAAGSTSTAATRSASTVTSPRAGGASSSASSSPRAGGASSSASSSPRAGGASSSAASSSAASSPRGGSSSSGGGGLQKGGIYEDSFLSQSGSHSTLRKRKTRKNINRRI